MRRDRARFTIGNGFFPVAGQGKQKTHFAFDLKLPTAGTAPNGSVKVWTAGRELTFECSTIEMLVVAGRRAQFWGTGSLNGVAARFRYHGCRCESPIGDGNIQVRYR